MRSSTILRILSVFVCLSLVLTYDLPVAGALEYPTETTVQGNETAVASDTSKLAGVELTDQRTSNTRRFLLSDKSFEAVVYGESVNYLDEKGTWQPIDNRLVERTTADGSRVLENRANGWTVRLSAVTGSTPLVEIEKGGKSIRWRLTGQTAAVAPEISTGLTDAEFAALDPDEQRQTPRNLYTTVTYRDLVRGCDVQYVIGPSSVRENLVFDSRADATALSTELELTGLTASLGKDGGIDLLDETGTPFMQLPESFAQDAEGARSLIITTNLEFSRWGSVFTDDQMAAAMIDRLAHHGHLVVFEGTSYRMEHALMKKK